MTLQEAKDQIAKKHGYRRFQEMIDNGFGIGTGELLDYSDEAAELYARSKWDEACEAQKELCCRELFITRTPKPEFKP